MSATAKADSTGGSVREHYGRIAREVAGREESSGCCASSCCGATVDRGDPITADLYQEEQTEGLPANAVLASLGCGNPTALADLNPGETVLDLGSGGGIDVLLSARRVGPTGRVFGLDMTDEMLALAEENRRAAGASNVTFLKGTIESIPLPASSVDVIISNCVINLSADKRAVAAEAFRVLKPGGRFAVSDVMTRGELPAEVRKDMELWTGCVAGAMDEREFVGILESAGFAHASVEPTRVYSREDAEVLLASVGLDTSLAGEIEGKLFSGFVRAAKPVS